MPAVRSATVGIWADVGSAVESPRAARHLAPGRAHALQGHARGEPRARSPRRWTGSAATSTRSPTKRRPATTPRSSTATCRWRSTCSPTCSSTRPSRHRGSRKEQKVVLEEIKMYDDSPDELIHDLFLQTMWSGSSLGRADDRVRGYRHGRDARRSARAHAARTTRRTPVVVAAAGNVEHERFVELVERAVRRASTARACRPRPERPATTPSRHVRSYKDAEQAYVVLGTRGLSTFATNGVTRSRCSTRFGRRHVEPALPGDSREARAGLQRLLVPGRVPRRRPVRRFCRDVARRTCRRASTSSSSSSAKRSQRARSARDELRLAKEHIKGNLTLSLEATSSRMIRLGRNEFALGGT